MKRKASALAPLTDPVFAALDDTLPALQPALRLQRAGRTREAVAALAAHLRTRPAPRPLLSRATVDLMRARAGARGRRQARAAVARALSGPLLTDAHSNALSSLGAHTLVLGLDATACRAAARRVAAARERWSRGPWGVTHSIVELVRTLLVVPECPDEALLAPLAWLLEQGRAEWAWARTWDEALLGNSGHNWWLHCFRGFFKAALFFPELKPFQRFRALGGGYFEREALILLERDGFTRERSGYHYGTADMLFEYRDLAREFGFPVGAEFEERLRAAAEVEWKVLAPSGELPHLGDGFADYRHTPGALERLRSLAVRFQLPEAKYVAERLDPGWQPALPGCLLHGDENLLPAYRALPLRAPATLDTALPATGYYFMRQDWSPKADWLSLEAGPVGTIVDSHDHTDIFSLELFSRGRPILVDNGSGPYGDSPERLWRVGSAGHNVAMVDGKDQVPLSARYAEWRWDNTVTPFVDAWVSDARYAYFSGAHEGYRSLPERVASARRKVFYLRGQYWILMDRFTPETPAEHLYELLFHVNPPCRLEEGGRLVTTGRGGNLLIAPVPGAAGEAALAPCPFPLEHYVRPDRLTYSRRGAGGQVFVTVLVPFENARRPNVKVRLLQVEGDERVLCPWEATGLEVVLEGRRDVYVDLHMAWNLPWRAGGHRGEGRLFPSQCQ
jgi:hypothetical protein